MKFAIAINKSSTKFQCAHISMCPYFSIKLTETEKNRERKIKREKKIGTQ